MKKFIFLIAAVLSLNLPADGFLQTINPPTNLDAEPENMSYIRLRWDDNSNNEDGFYIERSGSPDTNGVWETFGRVSQNTRQFFDYWVTNDSTYYYRVYAYSEDLRSPYSNIAYATAIVDTNIPRAPSNLTVSNTTPTTITIQWQDNSDNEQGFIIARRVQGEMIFRYIDTVTADVLTYQEVGLTPDNLYFYKVCSFNNYGLSDFSNTVSARAEKGTGIIGNTSAIPDGFFLGNNYPNPFNPSTNIQFAIPSNSFIELKIFNSLGKEVESLIEGQHLTAGTYTVSWNAGNLSSGIYFCKIIVSSEFNGSQFFTDTKKMLLTK